MSDTFDHEMDAFEQSWAAGDVDESEGLPCRYCGVLAYWGPHYDAAGNFSRRLFTAATRRPHDCRAKPDPDAFGVVPE